MLDLDLDWLWECVDDVGMEMHVKREYYNASLDFLIRKNIKRLFVLLIAYNSPFVPFQCCLWLYSWSLLGQQNDNYLHRTLVELLVFFCWTDLRDFAG